MEKESLRAAVASGLPEAVLVAVLGELTEGRQVVVNGAHIALAEHRIDVTGDIAEVRDRLFDAFRQGHLAPPTVDVVLGASRDVELARELFHLGLRDGQLTRISDQYVVAQGAIDALVADLRTRLDVGAGFTISEFKEWTGLSRKHSIPLLEHLDATLVTRRDGDGRVLN